MRLPLIVPHPIPPAAAYVTGVVLLGFLLHPLHHVDPAWFAVLGAVVLCVADKPMEVEKVVRVSAVGGALHCELSAGRGRERRSTVERSSACAERHPSPCTLHLTSCPISARLTPDGGVGHVAVLCRHVCDD